MVSFNNNRKLIKTLVAVVAITGFSSVAVAKITDSIFDGSDAPVRTAPAALSENPAVSEQLRYEKKVPVVELEQLLVEAEKAAAHMIEEHNRRVDMMAMQESYIKNLHSKDIRKKAEDLLNAARACNNSQVQAIYSCSTQPNKYYPAYVAIPNLLPEDKWGEYPKVCGGIWSKLELRLLGAYTEKLNAAKASAGIWWGGPYDGTLNRGTLFTEIDEDIAKQIGSDALYKSWQGLISASKRQVGAKGYYIENLINSKNVTPPSYSVFIKDKWDGTYNTTSDEWGSAQRMIDYRKQRWLVGYQFLMDIYHNEMFGALVDKGQKLWPDQKIRYTQEILENYFRYYESHYRSGWITFVERPDPVMLTTADYDDWDYYNHLTNVKTPFHQKLDQYMQQWHRNHHAEDEYCCCCWEPCPDGEGDCCCGTALIKCPVDSSLDGSWVSRQIPCPTNDCHDNLEPHPDLSIYPMTPPRPLIRNNGQPSVAESVYIDAEIKGDKYSGYKLDTFEGNSILHLNGASDGVRVAVPNVWANPFMQSIPASTYAYNNAGSNKNGATYNQSKVPTLLTFYKPTGAGLSPNYVNLGNISFSNYATIASGVGHLANNPAFPYNQNRISAFLDIYESFVKARDNETKLTGPYGVNKKLDKTLTDMLTKIKTQSDEGFFDINGKKTKEDWANGYLSVNGSFADAAGVDELYNQSLKRENWFYAQAKNLLSKIGVAIRKEENRTTYNYETAVKMSRDMSALLEPQDTGTGPSIPASESSEDQFLYRVGRVYQTLAYFGGGNTISGSAVTFKPSVSKVQQAMSQYQYSPDVMGEFETKVEKIRYDGKFTVPPLPSDDNTEWLDGGNAHTSRNMQNSKAPLEYEYKGDYIQIGPLAKVAPEITGKTLKDLEDGKIDDLLKKIDEQRTERFQDVLTMMENRGYWADRFSKEMKSKPSTQDFTFSIWNFNSSTCMFNRRSNQ